MGRTFSRFDEVDQFLRVRPGVALRWRRSLTKRTALDGETPNRSAAARRDIPPSTAWIILIRKSSDKGVAIRAGLLSSTQCESDSDPLRAVMRRRRFMTLLGSAAVVWPPAARAQLGSTLPTIGFLRGSQTKSETADAFIQGLKDAGYIERRTSERL